MTDVLDLNRGAGSNPLGRSKANLLFWRIAALRTRYLAGSCAGDTR
jgi:hypothetical protein